MESFFGTQLRGDWQNAELFKMMAFSANYTSEVTKLQGFSKFSNLSRELSFGTSLVYKEHMKFSDLHTVFCRERGVSFSPANSKYIHISDCHKAVL